jgi:hypothetical protein
MSLDLFEPSQGHNNTTFDGINERGGEGGGGQIRRQCKNTTHPWQLKQ